MVQRRRMVNDTLIRSNTEIYKLYDETEMVTVSKTSRMKWLEHQDRLKQKHTQEGGLKKMATPNLMAG